MSDTLYIPQDLQHFVTLPNGDEVDIVTDLFCCGAASGFNYEDHTLSECADFLADWYGGPDEHLQELISRDNLAARILSEFVNIGCADAA